MSAQHMSDDTDVLERFSLEQIAEWVRLVERRAPQQRQEGSGEALPRVWHVGVTNPSREPWVAEEMDSRGIDTFIPMIRFTRYRSRQHFVGEKPLLPRYVLFRREFSDQRLDGIYGLERIVRESDGMYARVPDLVVHELRVRARSGAFEASPHGTRFMRWLVDHGELPLKAIIAPKDTTKTKRNRVSRAAKKHAR